MSGAGEDSGAVRDAANGGGGRQLTRLVVVNRGRSWGWSRPQWGCGGKSRVHSQTAEAMPGTSPEGFLDASPKASVSSWSQQPPEAAVLGALEEAMTEVHCRRMDTAEEVHRRVIAAVLIDSPPELVGAPPQESALVSAGDPPRALRGLLPCRCGRCSPTTRRSPKSYPAWSLARESLSLGRPRALYACVRYAASPPAPLASKAAGPRDWGGG